MSWDGVDSVAPAGDALVEESTCRRGVFDGVCNNYMAVYHHISLHCIWY